MGKAKEGQAARAEISGEAGFVGNVEEEVGGGPKLRRGRSGERAEGTSNGPVERGDRWGKQGKGFELTDSRDEAPGGGFRAGEGHHLVEGGSEHGTVGE